MPPSWAPAAAPSPSPVWLAFAAPSLFGAIDRARTDANAAIAQAETSTAQKTGHKDPQGNGELSPEQVANIEVGHDMDSPARKRDDNSEAARKARRDAHAPYASMGKCACRDWLDEVKWSPGSALVERDGNGNPFLDSNGSQIPLSHPDCDEDTLRRVVGGDYVG